MSSTPTNSGPLEAICPVDPLAGEQQPVKNTETNILLMDAGAVEKKDIVSTEARVIDPATEDKTVADTTTKQGFFVSETNTFRTAQKKRSHQRSQRISLLLLIMLLPGIIIPLLVTVSYGIGAYVTYSTLRTYANSGVQHLLNVKTLFAEAKTHPAGVLDARNLSQAGVEFSAAHTDFIQMQATLDHSSLLDTVLQYLPQYRPQVTTVRAASQIGIDLAAIGQQLTTLAQRLAPRFRSPLLSNSLLPLITSADFVLIRSTLERLLPLLADIENQSHSLSLDTLPLSAHQRDQIMQFMQLLPQMDQAILWGHQWLDAIGWFLGVNQPRTFLVQTMDRAELRPTGGFTGQYGELHINGGRVEPFSLRDISLVEYADNTPTSGRLAPQAYRSWWPFANWGLRDSNLSADFPTSAQIAIKQYKLEVNHNVDGVILFTPFLIEHILQVIGPLQIPEYHETITAQNLEERLHFYQLDNAGIGKQLQIKGGNSSTSDRKRFTSLVAQTLMERVRHATPEELVAVGTRIFHDLKTRDLQIYATNPEVENLLKDYGDAAAMDRSTTYDGIYVVQANVSASKASQYVRTMLQDTVSLDSSGGATHLMQMRLVYNQIGPVYGLDTYRDYVRIYVPPAAKLLWGDGFDTGTPLCGGPFEACPVDGVYPHDELACPSGQYDAGASAPMLGDPYTGRWHPLDKIGPPTNVHSDEYGRAMFAGFVVIPKNCTMTITLSWYVPSIAHHSYHLLIQRQTATFPMLDLTVLPTPGDCALLGTSGLHVSSILTEDTTFLIKNNMISSDCYPKSTV